MNCPKHGVFHENHGCGVAVLTGPAYADHGIRCKLSPMHTPIAPWMNFTYDPNNPDKQWEQPGTEGYKYPPWEAPAGNCPICWHELKAET